MDVPVDASNELPPEIEPPIVLLVVALEVIDDSINAKVEDPPSKVDIPFDNAKVEDAHSVVVSPDVVVSIDYREYFTTKQKFATQYDLLEWVREEAKKLEFLTVIGKSNKGGNGRNAFVTMIYKRGGSYT